MLEVDQEGSVVSTANILNTVMGTKIAVNVRYENLKKKVYFITSTNDDNHLQQYV